MEKTEKQQRGEIGRRRKGGKKLMRDRRARRRNAKSGEEEGRTTGFYKAYLACSANKWALWHWTRLQNKDHMSQHRWVRKMGKIKGNDKNIEEKWMGLSKVSSTVNEVCLECHATMKSKLSTRPNVTRTYTTNY